MVTVVLPGRQQFGMCMFCHNIHAGVDWEKLASRHLLFGGIKKKEKQTTRLVPLLSQRCDMENIYAMFLISNFRRILNVVCFDVV